MLVEAIVILVLMGEITFSNKLLWLSVFLFYVLLNKKMFSLVVEYAFLLYCYVAMNEAYYAAWCMHSLIVLLLVL